jgi:hypothetical protein
MSVRVRFFPLFVDELSEKGIDPQHKQYVCGACGEKTTGRIVAETWHQLGEAVLRARGNLGHGLISVGFHRLLAGR